MARILTVGIAAVDVINEVAEFPAEDTECRALAHSVRRGGNAANTAVVLAQLGHDVSFCGMLVDEPDLPVITDDFDHYGVEWRSSPCRTTGKLPVSYITLSRATGSRTIVHYRDLPELGAAQFRGAASRSYDWVHFEGRNVADTAAMIAHLRASAPWTHISVEVEKPRDDIEMLYPLADYLLFSRDFAEQSGAGDDPQAFLRARRNDTSAPLLLSWGAEGAWGMAGTSIHFMPAESVTPVETVGAGDTFNAGAIDAWLQESSLPDVLAQANGLAARKCARTGFHLDCSPS